MIGLVDYHMHSILSDGKDAHMTAQIARHFESAVDLLTQIGYNQVACFKNRNRRMIRL